MKKRMVLISDIHFNMNNLELASKVMRQAIQYAERHRLPLVVAGDLHDTKAMMRGECVNAMIDIFSGAACDVTVIPGNHDRINEKAKQHALNFLEPYVTLIEDPKEYELNTWFIPYQHDSDEMLRYLEQLPTGATVICHQGVQDANMGHYIQDRSALPTQAFKRFRTIGGHYHQRQNIQCAKEVGQGMVGLFTYLGSPYSQSFGEATQGEKGFSVLYDDGSLELISTYLRRHIVLELSTVDLQKKLPKVNQQDLLWVKLSGATTDLMKVNKAQLGDKLIGHSNYKLDLVYTDSPSTAEIMPDNLTDLQILDTVIDTTDESLEAKGRLKALARELLG